jgi:hypothetical protein
MPPFERPNLNESSVSVDIQQTIENYRAIIERQLDQIAEVLQSKNYTFLGAEFKEKTDVIIKQSEESLVNLEKALKHSYSIHTPLLREKSIAAAKSTYEITKRGTLSALKAFLSRNNVIIDEI